VVASSLLLLLGVLFIVWSDVDATLKRWLLGGIFAVLGGARVLGFFANDLYRLAFQYDFAMGLYCVIFGVLLAIHPVSIQQLIPYAIAIYVLVDGLLKIQTAFDAKAFGMKHWFGLLISAIVISVYSVVLLIGFTTWDDTRIFLGVLLILDGGENVWNTMGTVRVRAKKEDRFGELL
jgi:uncharacterized membrane protein HdeD (DUF308 family)